MCGDVIGKVVRVGPDSFQWEIPNFPGLRKESGLYHFSPDIEFAEMTWEMWIFPNGTRDISDWVLLTLSRCDDGPAMTFRCAVGLRRADGEEVPVGIQTVKFGRGYARRVLYQFYKSAAECKEGEFLSSDALTVTLHVREEEVAASQVSVTLSQNLKDLYMSGEGCDVKFKVQDKSFSAHRIILRARNPVLAAMLAKNQQESETGVISVEDCDPESFEVFLIFLYCNTAANLTAENVMSVYHVADKYQVPELKSQCVRYLISNITVDNICDVLCLALKVNDTFLLEESSKFFQENAKEIFCTSGWEKFMVENTSKAKDLIIKYANTQY